ncbi:hypothetical protein QEZ40_005516 [Streptomyces katrae]|uniref:Apea-like HEPN domain-containing protein n=1 Tax=Streptomyces katrae TaxID=68223 RepID=A0ABT7H1W6_9ACTN|nr:hypothetical protein [Streptomyces katrae]MDK9499897.1 hypothetical protein [Streptomyces katrae]
MNEIRVDAVYQASSEPTVGRMCDIETALASTPLTTTVDEFQVVLAFPRFEGQVPAQGYAGWLGDDYAPVGLSPAYFTAHTVFDVDSSVEEAGVQEALKAAVAAIRFAAARLSDAIRVEQPSVGMVGEIPKVLSLTAMDTARGLELRVPEPLNPGYGMVRGLPVLTIERASQALRDGVVPARALLSQARHLTQSTNSPQPGMAILLAAVAAETHAKELFKSFRPPGSTPSLRSLQEKHGTAVDLYGPIAKAVIGRSLEDSDPTLWVELGGLFSARNKMAHRLKTPTHPDARRLVVAGMRAIEWLG